MKKTLVAALLGATLLAGGSAYAVAQNAPGRGGMLAQADTNNDGVVTRAEMLANVDARFAAADTDKNGQLSAEERRAARPQRGFGGRGGDRGGRMLERFDTDKDGKLSDAERNAAIAARGDRGPGPMRVRADANGDGLVSLAEERAQATTMFDRVDANKDGKIDAAEREAARPPRGHGRGGDDMPAPPADAPKGPDGN